MMNMDVEQYSLLSLVKKLKIFNAILLCRYTVDMNAVKKICIVFLNNLWHPEPKIMVLENKKAITNAHFLLLFMIVFY